MCNPNMTSNAAQSKAPEEAPVLIRKIGKTTYKVRIHFSNTVVGRVKNFSHFSLQSLA
ncbi:hypothetical protein H7U37_13295 [Pseudoflavonifractor phocaeensis]|uniref:hypothetical protein n=1 Tax=Pseudoflavonifractor phocaeensis TaxID=1870988 RepID=UPI00195E2060|nr:hypothetical protein [Pseudoflavonifractor phocaeensis]MBM6939488.1 hypothetical protein [Pseudoflavonifractor phocaeensis]